MRLLFPRVSALSSGPRISDKVAKFVLLIEMEEEAVEPRCVNECIGSHQRVVVLFPAPVALRDRIVRCLVDLLRPSKAN